jgi:hypothetical protein
MNENNHSMSIRDKIERQKKYLRKRKIEKEMSQNQNIKKACNHLVNFTSLKRELKIKKTTNRIAINRCLRLLKSTQKYINVFTKNNNV